MFPITKPNQVVPDLDSVATMKVCRVCLAMRVKMYHMLEHKLSVMYERVTGVEINTEDKLPQMLCWECVARLSSANHFKVKALKTQQILLNKVSGKMITIRDIESIDRVKNQLESSLKFFQVNDCNLNIIEGSNNIDDERNNRNINDEAVNDVETNTGQVMDIKIEISNSDEEYPLVGEPVYIKKEANCETVNCDFNEEVRDAEYYENSAASDVDFNNQVDLFLNKEGSIRDEIEIKAEQIYINEDINRDGRANKFDDMGTNNAELDISVKVEHTSKKDMPVDSNTEMSESHILGDPAPLWNQWSNTLPHYQEGVNFEGLSLSNYNTQHSYDQVIDHALATRCDEAEHDPINVDTETLNNTGNTTAPIYILYPPFDNLNIINPGNTSQKINPKTGKVKQTRAKRKDPRFQNLFICDICDNQYQKRTILIRHIREHSILKSYSCTYCNFKTSRKDRLTVHTNSKHTKSVSFNCTYCKYVTYRKVCLTEHINATHTRSVSYDCPHCSFKSYKERNLNAHINSKHTRKHTYNCSFCSFTSHLKSNLNVHVNAKHTKNISFNCSYCSFKTCSKSYLSRHINIKHTQEVSFSCDLCTYTTYHERNLKKHINSNHTRNVSYNCSYCSFNTYVKGSLTRHVNAKHT